MTTLLDRDFIPKQIVELKHNQANSHKVIKLKSIVDALLKQMLVRGFYGEVTLRFTVQDGMIQLIEECVGRKHR